MFIQWGCRPDGLSRSVVQFNRAGNVPAGTLDDILTRYIELKSRLTEIHWQLVDRTEEERWLCSIQT